MRKLGFARRWGRFSWQSDPATEVDEELAHHLDLLIAEGERAGLSPEEARRRAVDRFGADPAVRDACEAWARRRNRRRTFRESLSAAADDLRWAVRALRSSPGYVVATGGTLAMVVAANALVFAVVHSILLRPLPYPDPDRLVALNEQTRSGALWELSLPALQDWEASSRSFQAIGGWTAEEYTLMAEETPRVRVARVTAGFFRTMGTPPRLGRVLEAQDHDGGSGPALVLSHGGWLTHFGGDPGVLGRGVRLDATTYTVVGIMPPDFRYPDDGILGWTPFGAPEPWMRNRAVHIVQAVGRLREDLSRERAAEELRTIAARLEAAYPGADPGHSVEVRDLSEAMTGRARTPLLALLGSVGVMLMLACVNLAGLALTRTTARGGELALRAALGATRPRLIRQLLTESLVLGMAGGSAGLLVAVAVFDPVVALLPADVPRPDELRIDLTVAAVTLVLALGTGLVIGLLAAIRASRADLRHRLANAAGRATLAPGDQRLQQALLAVQLALVVLLVSGGGLLLRSLRAVTLVDPGFRPEGLLVASVTLPADRYNGATTVTWWTGLSDRLKVVPGVTAASAVSALPVSGGDGSGDVAIEGVAPPLGETPLASWRRVLPDYFRTAGIPLVEGREFTDGDRGDPMVVIISQAMARRLWPQGGAIGARIKIGPPEDEPWLTVVGVVGDVHNERLDAAPRNDTYEPYVQRPRRTMQVVVRAEGDASSLAGPLRAALRERDPSLPIWNVTTMEDRISASVAPRRFTAGILTGFGAAALLLAAIGVYGVTAYGVARRRREFAVRLALGASRVGVRRLVLRQAIMVAAAGLGFGLPAALVVARMVRSMLFGIPPWDPVTLATSVLLLMVLVVTAAWIPARRATLEDPVTALRE